MKPGAVVCNRRDSTMQAAHSKQNSRTVIERGTQVLYTFYITRQVGRPDHLLPSRIPCSDLCIEFLYQPCTLLLYCLSYRPNCSFCETKTQHFRAESSVESRAFPTLTSHFCVPVSPNTGHAMHFGWYLPCFATQIVFGCGGQCTTYLQNIKDR